MTSVAFCLFRGVRVVYYCSLFVGRWSVFCSYVVCFLLHVFVVCCLMFVVCVAFFLVLCLSGFDFCAT